MLYANFCFFLIFINSFNFPKIVYVSSHNYATCQC